MIHIVFSEADAAILQSAIEIDETLQGEIIQIKDNFAVGPLNDIYSEAGLLERNQWWKTLLEGGDFKHTSEELIHNDNKTIEETLEKLNTNNEETLWIWAAQNSQDVCGYYWLLQYVKELQGRIFILYLNNLPFINEKGNIFYPNSLSEIPAKEFLKAKKLAREITLSEFEVDPDEWTKLCFDNKGIRVLEGGKKLIQHDYEFYDSELKKYIMPDWQKASKIIHNFLSKGKHTISEAYLLWRLKAMIEMGLYDVQGKVANMKDFEIKYHSKA